VDGALPGDVAGMVPTKANPHFRRGAHVAEFGYPAEGFFATAAGHFGLDPYACDTTVDGYVRAGRYRAVVSRCTMNGGASGGPWIMPIHGVPTVVGINVWCVGPHHCRPLSRYVISSYFDRRYRALWREAVRAGAL
jgi:hypothetical protein